MPRPSMNALDRLLLQVAPARALARIRARAVAETMLRHYEAATVGRRTQNWSKTYTDANAASAASIPGLRAISRDLTRNNAWALNAKRVVTRNVVGYGITPKPVGLSRPERIMDPWRTWSGTTQCDAAGKLPFSGLQRLAMSTVFESGAALVRRRWRRPTDGLALPFQLQVLEPDFIDASKHLVRGQQGGETIYGVEYDAIGRVVAYWLFEEHPGASRRSSAKSTRVPASNVLHVFDVQRPGQEMGVPWLAAAMLKLKDFDEFEDAQLMRQKIAAMFAAFVGDPDGAGAPIGETSTAAPLVETIEPGQVQRLAAGQEITFGNPPLTTDDGFSTRTLRGIAAAIGVTYEDLTGDYSQVNFSSARMSRLAHWGNVYDWQWNLLIPQLCDPVWAWAIEAAKLAGFLGDADMASASWTPQPMPLIEPDREARANLLMVRSGQKTLPQVIREQGGDPDEQFAEIAATNATMDRLGIQLDSDPRRMSQAGLTQQRAGGGGGAGTKTGEPKEDDDGEGMEPAEE